jgi:hypothetical protein
MALNQRVFPRNNVDDCFFCGVAGVHGCLLSLMCGRCVRLRKNGGDVQRTSA